MEPHRIYRYTAIGRPLDPGWPSNKAVLYFLPGALVVGFGWTLAGGSDFFTAALSGLRFAAALFGAWALGRELLPDDSAAAFVAMAMALLACLAEPAFGLLTLFATLGLARIVNRSTGLKARVPDSFVVTALTAWTIYGTASPWFGAVGAAAFLLDGLLYQPLKRQWLFALLCFGALLEYAVDHDVALFSISPPDSLIEWVAVLAMVVFSLHLLLLRRVHARGDVGGQELDLNRVKAGMAIGVLATMQGDGHMHDVIVLVAVLGGLCLGIVFRRAFRSPAGGLQGPS